MKKKSLPIKLLALVAAVLCALGANAAEAYAHWTPSNSTLTFYYDNLRSTRTDTTFTVSYGPSWGSIDSDVKWVVFDATFAVVHPQNTYLWFSGMINLLSIANLNYFNTDSVTNMACMFQNCSSLTSLDLSGFNTANVTDMHNMFYNCSSLTSLDLSSFNTANVTDMYNMFYNCTSLTSLDVSSFSTSKVTNMQYMFHNCSSLTSLDLSGFNTAKVTSMYCMFYKCSGLTSLDLSSFNTAKVTTTEFMFDECSGLTSLDLSSFNTANVTNMRYMFEKCSGLTSLDLSSFNTANVTSMYCMFNDCSSLTSLDLSSFNTESVKYMDHMFDACSSLSILDLSAFNTSNVRRMSWMFRNCGNLTTIYAGSDWSTDSVFLSGEMFKGCNKLIGGQGTTYDASHIDVAYAHIDGGPSNPGYFTAAPEAYACYTPSNTTLTFYYDGQRSSRPGTTYDLNTGSNNPGWYTDGIYSSVTQVVFDPSFADARPTSTSDWFHGMTNLKTLTGMNNLKTDSVASMASMFSGCSGLTSLDLSSFNTDKVTNMASMFYGCIGLTSLDLSGFNTASVTSMASMFEICRSLTSLDVSSFNTASVTDMSRMFRECLTLTSLDVSNFNTANVTDMNRMFFGCTGLTSLYLSGFNTAKVTNMRYMFYFCSGLTSLDLSGFNTANVTDMGYMFTGNASLTTIYAGDGWSTAAVNWSTTMFQNCTSLVGGQGTTYDANHIDAEYAHIDGGPSNPGYFTEKVPEAYANWTPSDLTLTFYYDTQRSSRPGTTYDLNTGSNDPAWYTDGTRSSVTRVVFDPSFADARPTTTCGWFMQMEALESIAGLNYLNTEDVTNMSFMFHRCGALESIDLGNFNTANVTNMYDMFFNCYGLTSLDLSSFNTAKVTEMYGMFFNCNGLTSLDLSSFNTAKVTNMAHMFIYCRNLTTIEVGAGWSTAAATLSNEMFLDCTNLVGGKGTTYDANHVDAAYAHIDGGPSNPGYFTADPNAVPEAYAVYTSSNTTLTFYYDNQRSTRTGTTYDLNEGSNNPGWYTDNTCSSVTHVVFDPSFAGARPNSTIGWFYRMSNLTTITGIEYLNTSEVTNMGLMFYYCKSLTSLDVSNFNTAKVITMDSMFAYCENLTTIYAGDGWSIASLVYWDNMLFYGSTSLVGGMGTTYDANHVDAAYARIDGGPSCPGYFSEKEIEAYANWTPSDSTLTFYYDTQRSSRLGTTYDLNRGSNDPDMGSERPAWRTDGTYSSVARVVFDPSFAGARPTTTYYWFYGMRNLETITGIENLNTEAVTNMCSMFDSCSGLTSLDVSHFNTSNVTDMNFMFYLCSGLTSLDLSSFNTSNVTDMHTMFASCSGLTSLDLSSFNTSNVTDMQSMFSRCSGLTSLDVSSFNTANVTNMCDVFYGCSGLTSLDVSSFNTSSVTNMIDLFAACSSLSSLDLSSFNTSNVTHMQYMFYDCSGLTSLDLSGFNTAKVTNMGNMFKDCSDLTTIYVGNGWSTAAVTSSTNMFLNCTSLVGGQGTTYDANHVDVAYAHVDGGPSNPGYFSSHVTFLRGDVDSDNNVNIDDVTALIDYLLGTNTGINLQGADCDESGNISIDDVTTLIDYLLSGAW